MNDVGVKGLKDEWVVLGRGYSVGDTMRIDRVRSVSVLKRPWGYGRVSIIVCQNIKITR